MNGKKHLWVFFFTTPDDNYHLAKEKKMYFFAPLEKYFEKGLGAVADSFRDAAMDLKESYNLGRLNGHLSIRYLFRHSIELCIRV